MIEREINRLLHTMQWLRIGVVADLVLGHDGIGDDDRIVVSGQYHHRAPIDADDPTFRIINSEFPKQPNFPIIALPSIGCSHIGEEARSIDGALWLSSWAKHQLAHLNYRFFGIEGALNVLDGLNLPVLFELSPRLGLKQVLDVAFENSGALPPAQRFSANSPLLTLPQSRY